MLFDPGSQFFQCVHVVSDGASLEDVSLQIHQDKIMLVSRPVKTNDNHSGLLSVFSYNKGTDEPFVSGIPMKALSIWTGDSVSAVCECQDAVSSPFRPSRGRKSRALPHPGPACFVAAAQRLQSNYSYTVLYQYEQTINS